jgi:hypothetical protein
MRVVTVAACVAVRAGCAPSPTRIQAAYVSPAMYNNLTCDQVDTEIMAVDSKAEEMYRRLKHVSNSDAWKMGIGLLVTWPALLFLSGGDGADAAAYAQLKGQKDALIDARRHCASHTLTGTAAGEIPGTIHYGKVTIVPAKTPSGLCIIAPANYVGTGAANMPAITNAMLRCSDLPPVK